MDLRTNGQTSNIIRVALKKAADGTPLTGLTSGSSGLIIGTIADNEATTTAYTQAGSTIESISTLGTFSAPTATKCRFKEIDATNHPGDYEIQIADARYAVSNAKKLIVSFSGATGLLAVDYEVMLASVNWFSATAFITGVNSLAPPTNWNLMVVDASGRIDLGKWIGVTPNALNAGKVDAVPVGRANTATAGTSTALTLDAGASAVDNYYTGLGLIWTSGANIGVTRIVTGYVGSTKVATFAVALPATADTTPTFIVTEIRHLIPGTDGKVLVSTDTQDLSATLSVNAKSIGGVGQTGRDIGASVLLSNGVGTGQVKIAAGYLAMTWADIAAPASAVDFTNTTIKNLDGNTVQTGDAFGRIGVAGSGLTNLGDTRIAHLDADVTSRMSTFALPTNFASLAITAGGAVTLAAGQLFVKKNTQLVAFMFVMTDATNHNPATGLTVTPTRSIDGGAFGACANAVAEVANGWYKITLAATDLNGTVIALRFTAAASDDKDLTIITQA